MNAKPAIRVVVVDDSGFMRRAIARMLVSADDIVVVGTAATGEEAIAMQLDLKPDIMTMDVEMPGMGGLEAARTIVAAGGPPIIMISSLTQDGAQTTLRALEIGAVDFIAKPDSATVDILTVKDELIEKVREFGAKRGVLHKVLQAARAAAPPLPVPARAGARTSVPPARVGPFECVAIGTSTGGPVALATVLPKLPANFPLPILVVQHMPPGFTKALSERLNATSEITVVEGENGMLIANGTAIIAPAGRQLTLRRTSRGVEVRLEADTKKSLHVPSVDVLTAAVGEMFGAAALGVILTGMGHDGVAGLAVIKKNGGYVIGQDEASSVVYGMPRAAAVAGFVDRVVPLADVARTLCEMARAAYVAR